MTLPALNLLAALAALTGPPRTDIHSDPLPPGAIARFGNARFRVGATTLLQDKNWDLSADGKTLTIETPAGLMLVDTDTGLARRRYRLPGFAGRVNDPPWSSVRMSPDGKSIVRLTDSDLRILVTDTGRTRVRLEQEFSPSFSFLPGSSRFAVIVSGEKTVNVYDAKDGRKVSAVATEQRVCRISPAGGILVGEHEKGLSLLDAKTGLVRVKFPEDEFPADARFDLTPDDRLLCAVWTDGRFRVFDTASGKKLEDVLVPPDDSVPHVSSSAWVVAGSGVAYVRVGDREVWRRDLKAGKWLLPLPRTAAGAVLPHPDGKRLFVLEEDGLLRRYDLVTRREILPPDGYEETMIASASPNGRRVAIRTTQSNPERLDVLDPTGRLVWSCLPSNEMKCFAWSPDSNRLACVEYGPLVFRDASNGKVSGTLELPTGLDASDAFFTADGHRLIVPLDDLGLAAFDLRSGRCTVLRQQFDGSRFDASPDGRALVSSHNQPGVRLFDPAAGCIAADPIEPADPSPELIPFRALFSPDGSFVLSWDFDGTAILRDPRTLRVMRTYRIGLSKGSHVAISPNGLWFATGEKNGILSLWDVSSGRRLGTWEGHQAGIINVSFAGPGHVVTSSADLTALIWELRPRERPSKPVWEALTREYAVEAYRALWALAVDPNGPELLRTKVATVTPPPAEKVRRWLADLGADRYSVREAATKELQALGRLVEPELKAARARATSEEVRTRIDGLLAKIGPERTPAELVQARAVAAMELAGTPAAKKLLAEWAAGAPGARLTIDAKAALTRVGDPR